MASIPNNKEISEIRKVGVISDLIPIYKYDTNIEILNDTNI